MARMKGGGGRGRGPTYNSSGKNNRNGRGSSKSGRKLPSSRNIPTDGVFNPPSPPSPNTKGIKVGLRTPGGRKITGAGYPGRRFHAHGYRAHRARFSPKQGSRMYQMRHSRSSLALDGDFSGSGNTPNIKIVRRGSGSLGDHTIVRFPTQSDSDNNSKERTIYTSFKKKDIRRLSVISPEFDELLKTGRYFFYNGKIILLHPKVVRLGKDPGKPSILKDVHQNPSLYCLKVVEETDGTVRIIHAKKYGELTEYEAEDFYKNTTKSNNYLSVLCASKTGRKSSSSKGTGTSGKHQGKDESNELPPIDLMKLIIDAHLKRMHMSLKAFAVFIGMNEETIRRLYTRPDSRTELINVVGICLGLHMEPATSKVVIDLSGNVLLNRTDEEKAFTELLCFHYMDPIEKDNQYMIDHHLTAFTSKF